MSEKRCCVPGCYESAESHQVLHLFPHPEKERTRFNLWLMAIGGDILALNNEYIYRRRRVCHAHFVEKHCCRFNRISNIAVPTKNLPDPLSLPSHSASYERRPMRQIQLPMEISVPVSREAGMLAAHSESLNDMQQPTENLQSLPAGRIVDVNLDSNKENCPSMEKLKISGKISYHKTASTTTKKSKKNSMTKGEGQLYSKLVKLRVKLSKCRNKLRKQSATIRAAKSISNNADFLKTMENLPSAARILTMMQVREHKKKGKGRRFSLDEKILTLSIFKQSPKAYRFLRKILILPAPQTLIKVLHSANIEPGLNKKVFAQLSQKAKKMKPEEKLCILLFDEMSLKASIQYNERKDKVIGFVTDGVNTKHEYADHAQVFLIRGLMKNYKQPISYTFSSAATKGPELAKQIKNVVLELQTAGLEVVATVCDQGANNRTALKILINETRVNLLKQGQEGRENVFIINNKEIVPLYDTPHLLKCVRNNLMTKDLKYKIDGKEGIAKWQHLELLHKENPGYKNLKLIPKMTDSHVIPKKIAKMKVKYAAQIFSQTVAKNMGYLADKKILPPECKDTANILLFFDSLFDSVNGSYQKTTNHAKPLKQAVTPFSVHNAFWNNAKNTLKGMKFIDPQGRMDRTLSLINWVWTLDNIQLLLKKLKNKYSITSVWMRHLNQDPIENFFGSVRSHGCRNNNPTPEQFEAAYSTLLINNLSSVHTPGRNCEKDNNETLHALIISEEDCKDLKTTNFMEIPQISLKKLSEKHDPKIIAPLQYVSGYFLREGKKTVFKGCKTCNDNLFCKNEIEYIKYREYAGRNWLCSPSSELIECLSNFQDIYDKMLNCYLIVDNLKCFIKTIIIINVSFNFIKCEKHKEKLIDFFIDLCSRFFINHYCKNINNIMCGKAEYYDDEGSSNKAKAKKMFNKCYKRKNKV